MSKYIWITPAADEHDEPYIIRISAALGPLMLELQGFDGYLGAAEARELAQDLQQAADELEGCRIAPEGER